MSKPSGSAAPRNDLLAPLSEKMESLIADKVCMGRNSITFVILSFEGPDVYSHVGGLGTRVIGLSDALARMGFETHLFFVGDPDLPDLEYRQRGMLHLHRWCRQTTRRHQGNAYGGQESKLREWGGTLPLWLEDHLLAPKLAEGGRVVVLAEEWHMAPTIIALRRIIERRNWQRQVQLVWNANNTYSFDRVDWERLRQAATLTTVSRHMKQIMAGMGVEAQVIANGIPQRWLRTPAAVAHRELSSLFRGRHTLVKMARWDPDKSWCASIDAVTILKRAGLRPLLIARGGAEAYGRDVLAHAANRGLSVSRVSWDGTSAGALTRALGQGTSSDVILLEKHVTESQRRALFQTADAVLANSRWEPFGLVGLETMSVGGIAVVGCTGEDYATPGHDSLSVQTEDPFELVRCLVQMQESPSAARRMRRMARESAARYAWPSVIQGAMLPALGWVTAGGGMMSTTAQPALRGLAPGPVLVAGVERARAVGAARDRAAAAA